MAFGIPNLRLSRAWREHIRRWKDKIIDVVVYPWNLLISSFRWIGSTLVNAWGTRHLRYALQGVPALLAVVGVCVLGANVLSMDPSNLATKYLAGAFNAIKQDKNDVARSLLEKAIKLEQDKDEFRFYLAVVLEKDGQIEHCVAIMKKLAPENANGHAPAHMWIGDYIWRNYKWTNEIMDAMQNHFEKAWRVSSAINHESSDSKMAAYQMGRLLLIRGRIAESVPFLERVVDMDPSIRLALAGAYQRLDRHSDMERTLEILAAKCKQKLDENANDKETRVVWANALVGLDKFAEAIEVLKAGIVHDREDPRFNILISNALAAWDFSILRQPDAKDKLLKRFALVQQGLLHQPINRYHLARLLEFADLKGEDGEKAKKIMQDLLSKSQSAPIIHFLMGNKAIQEDRMTEAQYHWEKAFALDPNFAAVSNNLAWILAHQKEPDYERALQIIKKTIEKMPGVSNFYGTQGVILHRMGKHKEALPDLERGVAGSPNDAGLQEALAECHKQLGNIQMSEIHKKKADELRAAKAKQKPDLPTSLNDTPPSTPTTPPTSPPAPKDAPAGPPVPKEKEPPEPKAKSG